MRYLFLIMVFTVGCTEVPSVSANPENVDELSERLDALTERVQFLETQIVYTFEFEEIDPLDPQYPAACEEDGQAYLWFVGVSIPSGIGDYVVNLRSYNESSNTNYYGNDFELKTSCGSYGSSPAVVDGKLAIHSGAHANGIMITPVNPS